MGSYKWDTLDRHHDVTGRPFLPQLYEALFSITLTFRVDDTDINMLELVSRAGECSVETSCRPTSARTSCSNHVARQGSAESSQLQTLQVKAGRNEDVKRRSYKNYGASRGILGLIVISLNSNYIMYCPSVFKTSVQ